MCTSSVFNPEWDMPEYYQNEFIKDDKKKHITIRPKNENFCGDFKCVSLSEKAVIVSNSERQFGYATKICPAGLPQSCIHSIWNLCPHLKSLDTSLQLLLSFISCKHIGHVSLTLAMFYFSSNQPSEYI